MTAPKITVADLNHFTVRSLAPAGDRTLLTGDLSLPGQARANDDVYLYVGGHDDIAAGVVSVDPDRATATFKVFTESVSPLLAPGARFPVYNSYWYDAIHCVLDPDAGWAPQRFSAPDSFVHPSPDAPGWNVSRPAEPGDELRTDGHIVPGGWDHEHCLICNAHIDAEHPDAYVNAHDQWVCRTCYDRYVGPQDLRFLTDWSSDETDPAFSAIQSLMDRYDLAALRRHLAAGHAADVRNPRGWTPLMVAALPGHLSLLSLLLDGGANPNAVSTDGYTPLALAAQAGHYEAVERLLAAGATPAVPPHFFNGSLLTYLQTGPGQSDPRVIERLTAAGAT